MQMELKKLKIDEIIVKDRIRNEIGDLDRLENSIRQYGLLSPLVVNADHILISGLRRLEACRNLNMAEIQVLVVPVEDGFTSLDMECQENLCRKTLTDLEIDKIIDRKKQFLPKALQKATEGKLFKDMWGKLMGKGKRGKS